MPKFLMRLTMFKETPCEVRYEMQKDLSEYYFNKKSDSYMVRKSNEYVLRGYQTNFLSCYFSYMEEKKYK